MSVKHGSADRQIFHVQMCWYVAVHEHVSDVGTEAICRMEALTRERGQGVKCRQKSKAWEEGGVTEAKFTDPSMRILSEHVEH